MNFIKCYNPGSTVEKDYSNIYIIEANLTQDHIFYKVYETYDEEYDEENNSYKEEDAYYLNDSEIDRGKNYKTYIKFKYKIGESVEFTSAGGWIGIATVKEITLHKNEIVSYTIVLECNNEEIEEVHESQLNQNLRDK